MTDTSGVQPPVHPSPAAQALPAGADRRSDVLAYGALALLAYVVTLVFIVIILKLAIDPVALGLVTMVVTAVIATAAAVFSFQFGSSKGSQMKDIALTATAAVPPPPTTP